MLIRRFLLTLLAGGCIASPLLAEARSADAMSLAQEFAPLDSLLRTTPPDFYIPTPIQTPSLLEAVSIAPSLPAQLLDYYRQGGREARERASLLLPALLLPSHKRLMRLSYQPREKRLSIPPIGSLSFLPPTLPWDNAAQLAPSPSSTATLDGYALAYQLSSSLGLLPHHRVKVQLPRTLALARPAEGTSERALRQYTQETKLSPGELPSDRSYLQALKQRHWIPSLESAIQFSQNQVSENWYKGGASNLNVYMRNFFGLRYVTDRVLWNNELESRLSVYNADRDSLHRYRIADDLLRLRSNYGLKAWNKVYYTLDAELRTQLFQSFQENKDRLQSDLLAPYTINVGLGMKFDYTMKSTKVYGRAFTFSINVAPLSYTYRATRRSDIDLARHGLATDKLWYQKIGSTVRANWQWKVNMNLTWTSRMYFNTSYESVEAEWENTLDMALTRYFSTRFNLNLRFDDGVRPAPGWNKYLQYNELLSFGFSYRL